MPPTATPPSEAEMTESAAFHGSVASFMAGLPDIDSQYQIPNPNAPATPPAAKQEPAKEPEKPAEPAAKAEPTKAAEPAPVKAPEPKATEPAAKADEAADARPRTQADWDNYKSKHGKIESELRTELKTREQTLKELQAKVQQFEEASKTAPTEDPTIKATIDELKKQNDELSTRLQAVAVTQHPRFQQYFENKTNAEIIRAKQIVGPDAAEAIERALKMPDDPAFTSIKNSAIEEIMANLTPLQASRIGGVLNNLSAISDERTSEIAKANENASKMHANESAAQSERLKKLNSQFDSIAKAVQDPENGLAIFQKRADNPEWNREVDSRIQTAKSLIMGKTADGKPLSPEAVMRGALDAVAFPAVLQAYKADIATRDDAIAKLTEQVKALSAAQPTAGRAGSASPVADTGGGDGPGPKHGMNPMQASAEWARMFKQDMNG